MSLAPLPLRLARAAIEDAFVHGASLEGGERDISDATAVGEDGRASLWLFAWGTAELDRRTPAVSGRRPDGP